MRMTRTKMMNDQCFIASDDQVFAIMNWYLRKDEFDVMILDPLDTQDIATYTRLCGQGITSKEIYKKLYPDVEYKPKEKALIDVDLLTKDQLTQLINTILGKKLPTLMYMSTKDLLALYSVLNIRY